MAARYVRIGQYPDYRDEIRGTLSEILASTANPGTYAAPEDVAGCTLEMGADGLWTGASVGTLTKAQADALVAAGVMASVKAGVPAQVDGFQYTWQGVAGGWIKESAFISQNRGSASSFPTSIPTLKYEKSTFLNPTTLVADFDAVIADKVHRYSGLFDGVNFSFVNGKSFSFKKLSVSPWYIVQASVSSFTAGSTNSVMQMELVDTTSKYHRFTHDKNTGAFVLSSTMFGTTDITGTLAVPESPYTIGLFSCNAHCSVLLKQAASDWQVVATIVVGGSTTDAYSANYYGKISFAGDGSAALALSDIRQGSPNPFGLADHTAISNEDGTPYLDERGNYYITMSGRFFAKDVGTWATGGINPTVNLIGRVDRYGNLSIIKAIYASYDRYCITASPIHIVRDRQKMEWWGVSKNHILDIPCDILTGGTSRLHVFGDFQASGACWDTVLIKRNNDWRIYSVEAGSVGTKFKQFYGIIPDLRVPSGFTRTLTWEDDNRGEGLKVVVIKGIQRLIVGENNLNPTSWSLRDIDTLLEVQRFNATPVQPISDPDTTYFTCSHCAIVPLNSDRQTMYHAWTFGGVGFYGNRDVGYGEPILYIGGPVDGNEY